MNGSTPPNSDIEEGYETPNQPTHPSTTTALEEHKNAASTRRRGNKNAPIPGGGKTKRRKRRKKGAAKMSSIEGKRSIKMDCTNNKIDKENSCYMDPISLECLDDEETVQVDTEDKTCFDKNTFCRYANSRVVSNLPINNPMTNKTISIEWVKKLGCPGQNEINKHQQAIVTRQQAQQQAQQAQRERQLIRNNGSYQVQGDDFWQGDMTMESWYTKPCCSKCEPYGCMSYLGCGENKCTPCDENLQPGRGQRRCDRRGGRRTRRKRKRKTKRKRRRKTKRKKRRRKKRKTRRKTRRSRRKKQHGGSVGLENWRPTASYGFNDAGEFSKNIPTDSYPNFTTNPATTCFNS